MESSLKHLLSYFITMIIMLLWREQQGISSIIHITRLRQTGPHGVGLGKDTGLTVSQEVSLSRHVVGKHPTADAHRPQELVDIVRAVTSQTYSRTQWSNWRMFNACH
jgi:hypothetical protein